MGPGDGGGDAGGGAGGDAGGAGGDAAAAAMTAANVRRIIDICCLDPNLFVGRVYFHSTATLPTASNEPKTAV